MCAAPTVGSRWQPLGGAAHDSNPPWQSDEDAARIHRAEHSRPGARSRPASRTRTPSALRIALTVNYSPWSPYCGGGQRSTHELAVALARRGHAVTVVYSKPPWERVALPIELPYDVRWAVLPALRSGVDAPLRPLSALGVAAHVRALAREAPELVVHANGEESALLPAVRRALPFAFVVTPRYPSFPARLGPKHLALGVALRGADRWCPTSASSAATVAAVHRVPLDRCRPIPNGVSPVFGAQPRSRDAPSGPLLFFGRMCAEKGPRVVLEALARIGDPQLRLELVGRGSDEAEIVARAHALGLGDRVTCTPWLEPAALAERIAAASIVVLPSREESFGNAMVEAMAVGAPLVTTRVGSIPELCDDGVHARLVAPDDPAALAEAIAALRRDPAVAEALGRAGRDHVARRYSWDATARAFEQVYGEALAMRRAAVNAG